MKKNILISFFFQLITFVVLSQTKPVTIHTSYGATFSGYVISSDTLSVMLTKGWSKKALEGKKGYYFVPINVVEKIELKGKKRVGAGASAGGGVGLALGVGVLENEKKQEPDFDTGPGLQIGVVSFFGAVGSGLGGLLGLQVRKTEKVFEINRRPDLLKLYFPELKSR
ncbi:MAG: hypothetical protein AAFZ15_33320 [Bacteroidota bacterium]